MVSFFIKLLHRQNILQMLLRETYTFDKTLRERLKDTNLIMGSPWGRVMGEGVQGQCY